MNDTKIKIKIGIVGYLPFPFDKKTIKNHSSKIFEIVGDIEEFHFNNDSDTELWGYSDETLNDELPDNYNADFFIGITYVPIENNFYARRLENNRIVLSYYEMYQILTEGHTPLENLVLRVLYAYSLVYLRQNNRIPPQIENIGFTHDDTRGCLFDMNGNKTDVLFSLDKPIICDDCTNRLRTEKVSDNKIEIFKKEIRKIKKKRFYKLSDFVKSKPILSLILSILLGILISLSATLIFETSLKKIVIPDNKKDTITNDTTSIKHESTTKAIPNKGFSGELEDSTINVN